jgi:D-xylose transport system substrate-binding protein
MKRTYSLLFILVLLISTAFGQTNNPKIKIGFCLANYINIRWYKDTEFFEKKVNELGGQVLTRDASNDPQEQLQQAIELMDSGAKVLVIVPVDGKNAGSIITEAHKRGVKVIAYDRLIMDCPLDYYISFKGERIGELMASYVTKLKPKGNYVLINGPTTDHNSVLIKSGILNVLDPLIKAGDIKLVYNVDLTEWIEMDAYQKIDDYLQKSKDIDVIITGGDIVARGVLMSLDEWKLSGKVLLTGQNADLQSVQDIIAGRQTMTIYKSLHKLAETSAEVAMKLAVNDHSFLLNDSTNNGKINVPSILFEPVVVDKTNIKETVIADGHLTEKEIYKK